MAGKYIGETEINLRGVFRFTERGQAIFLFDEAGAVYGRRRWKYVPVQRFRLFIEETL